MSTLTGNKISLTYKSLIKTADNDVLSAALKELSDGLGNNSGVFLNTGGDLKSTGILEFANFKGTSTSVTINKLVNEADGISNNDNDTSLATSAAVKDYVDTHVTTQDLDFSDGTNPGAVDLDSQVFAIVGTSNEIETSASGQQLQIGLPNDVTISGTYTGTTFSGDLSGTINTATTATTQTAGDNSTKVATTAYVDTLDAASDLDFSDGTNDSAVNLNTQVLSIEGTSKEIITTASGQSLTVSLDSTGVDLPDNTTAITQTAGDNSTKVATTAYVDVLDAASDLDIAGDTGTGDVNLNTQTLTLQGTTNQITTAVSGQTTTFSLPSTVHRNLQGDVTGDLTGNSAGTHTGAVIGNVTGNVNGDVTGNLIGNADTATAWETARDLILSSEATGTISSVDGTQNVTGAVTLLNSAVTGKVLTGLPTPSAGNIQASDTILEAFGKLQSQVSSISNGLIFKGSWDAATNTPTLTSGGGEVDQGTTTGQAANKLIDTSQNFNVTVSVGDKVINQVDGQSALVTVIDSNTQLSLDADIMLSSEAYTIDASPFIQQGQYYVVNYAGTTNLNGITDWSIGDWVIADADNRWSKLDHSQVDGQGSIGHLPVWTTANTLGDSIVSESGTALTVTGSLDTTLGASVTGDFAVNTNKFTVAAASGNTVVAGDVTATQYNVSNTSGYLVREDTGSGYGLFKSSTTNIGIASNGNVALNFDSSSNATFAGKVGIGGANSPSASLQIGTNVETSSDELDVRGNSSGNYIASFEQDHITGYGILIDTDGTLVSEPVLKIKNSSSELFYVGSNGNVGIGTDSPETKMQIQRASNAINTEISFKDGGGTRTGVIGMEGATTNDMLLSTLGGIRFYTASNVAVGSVPTNERMIIDNSGNVGIGTDDPYAFDTTATKLHVKNEGSSGSVSEVARFEGSADADGSGGTIRLGTSNDRGIYFEGGRTGSAPYGKIGTTEYDGAKTVAITLDGSGNSTFTGTVEISATIPRLNFTDLQQDDWAIINDNGEFKFLCSTGSGVALQLNTNNNATFGAELVSANVGRYFKIQNAAGNANFPTYSFQNDGNTGMLSASSDSLGFITGGTTALTLDSAQDATFAGNVTAASNSFKVEVDGSGNTLLDLKSTGGQQIRFFDTNSSYTEAMRILRYDDKLSITYGDNANEEALTIVGTGSTAGNVGIGTTSPAARLHLKSAGTGNVLYVESSDGHQLGGFFQESDTRGAFNVRNASGTPTVNLDAGGNSWFNGGNVGIGTTSPFTNLEVAGSGADSIIRLYASGGTADIRTWEMRAVGVAGEGLLFRQVNDANNSYTNRMIIDTDGNVGIGTISPSSLLTLNKASGEVGILLEGNGTDVAKFKVSSAGVNHAVQIGTISNNEVQFHTNNTERMRITSGGSVGIGGAPDANSILHIKKTDSGIAKITLQSLNNQDTLINYTTGNNEMCAGFESSNFRFTISSGETFATPLFYVEQGGNAYLAGTLTQSSDIRLKENIKPLESQLEIVNKLNPVSYNKIGKEENEIGFIAQEVEEFLPDLVIEDEKGYKSLAYGNMNAILVKAIQELKAEVDLLKHECKCK